MKNKNLSVNVNITDTEFFKNLAIRLSELIYQIEKFDFKDGQGHLLKNDTAYVELIEYIGSVIEREEE